MTLYAIIEKLKMLALKHPNVNSAYEGNIYDIMNANPQQKYASVVLTQQSHTQDDTYDHYGFNLFYVDRLVDDLDSNRVQIQSTGKSMLSNIIKAFCEEFDAECETINYQTFTERFADECAGVYCTITIDMVKDIYCTEKYWDESWVTPMVTVRNQNKSVQFTANGIYTIDYDADKYSGLGKVEVEVNVPDLNGSYDEGYEDGKTDGREEGYADGKADGIEEGYSQGKTDGYSEGKTDGYTEGKEVGINEQKSKLEGITITENGTYTKEDGYNHVEVELPIQTDKMADIRINGTYVITPDDDYVALDKLVLNVEAKGKVTIPNGLSFMDSTFTEFPVENYDWSAVRDTTAMFMNCTNLNTAPIIEAVKDGTIPTLNAPYMFKNTKVAKLEGIDFTKFFSSAQMFFNVIGLEEVKNCVLVENSSAEYIYSSNKAFKLIDCDVSNLQKIMGVYGWYFGKFQNVDTLTELRIDSYPERVYVMECNKPSNMKTSAAYIWYDDTKYSGWDAFSGSNPYGFYYNVISKTPVDIMIKQPESETRFQFEQVIPYNEEKGCHYIDYPYYMKFDVYVNNQKIDLLANNYNVDVYIPSNEVGVYEGEDIKNLIYYALNSNYYEVNDNGLFVLRKNESAQKQGIITPTDSIKITATAGAYWILIYKNGVEEKYSLSTSDETEHIIDTSDCDYIDVMPYIKDITKTYIRKIEIL